MPDGQIIKLGRERFEAPEILMDPTKAGLETIGCGEMVFKSISVITILLSRIVRWTWGKPCMQIFSFLEELQWSLDFPLAFDNK